jgi:hypothetical protein
MNEASEMAAREARARTQQPDDNVGTFRRWIGITVIKNQGIWCLKCHLPTGGHWKDGEHTVFLSLGRWNGTFGHDQIVLLAGLREHCPSQEHRHLHSTLLLHGSTLDLIVLGLIIMPYNIPMT